MVAEEGFEWAGRVARRGGIAAAFHSGFPSSALCGVQIWLAAPVPVAVANRRTSNEVYVVVQEPSLFVA